jgi:Zn-dependent protease
MASQLPPPGDSWQEQPHDATNPLNPLRDEYVPHGEGAVLHAGDQLLAAAGSEKTAAVAYRRRVRLPIILFLATCLSTWLAGVAVLQRPLLYHPIDFLDLVIAALRNSWDNGLAYMFAVMSILLAHEMGHFLMTLRYRIPASFPFFIPMVPPLGTMGAVIAMQGSRADRKQLFDIGLAGPLAGLVVALPVLCAGIYLAEPASPYAPAFMVTRLDGGETKVDESETLVLVQPLATRLLVPVLRPDLAGHPVRMNALLLAGWVGLLITGLNMIPMSQLDGGHVAYALFRRRAHHLATACLFLAIIYIVASAQMPWVLMLVLIVLIGIYHPPTANDHARLGKLRTALGWASLVIPVFCLPPTPIELN